MPPQLVPNRARKKSPSTPDKAANGISNVSIDCSHDCDGDGPDDRPTCRGVGLGVDLRDSRCRARKAQIAITSPL